MQYVVFIFYFCTIRIMYNLERNTERKINKNDIQIIFIPVGNIKKLKNKINKRCKRIYKNGNETAIF